MAYRSQLLNRFVEGFFGDTNDNGIVISNYLPITFAENWTYSRALYKDNKNYTHVTGIYFHFLKHYSFLGVMKELLPPATQTMMFDLKRALQLLVHYFLSY